MKTILFICLALGVLTSPSFKENESIMPPKKNQAATKIAATTMLVGPDCKVAFERKCYGGAPLVVLPGEIADPFDSNRFCSSHPISCSMTECSARLNVMFGFLPGSPKSDSCLPAGYRGK
ncbi:hypothetical protein [Flavobacterium sp. ZB4P13]|uniref:hypothetical protein n=1 Tax=Flavobacterium sp. ZB4P13 TaxID=3401728 RepID=UPI003AAF63E0